MKILHICFGDKRGGAAMAAFRHCEAMRRAGINAAMLVVDKQRRDILFSYSIYNNQEWRNARKNIGLILYSLLAKCFCRWGVFSFPLWSYPISRHPLVKKADVIYLHWVAGGMLTSHEIGRMIGLGKKIIWYLHDMNPITGGCHYAMDCLKYAEEDGCHDCPFLKKWLEIDLAAIQFKKRMKYWHGALNIEVMTPSVWLSECALKSTIWKGHKVTVFPNVLDTNRFKPLNKLESKQVLNLNISKYTILFGADSINSVYKGWNYLRDAINMLDSEKYEIVAFGNENMELRNEVKMNCIFTGFLKDEDSLIRVYNAADVFVSSSLADNFPNVLVEAMSCGVPCVGFNVGGVPDLISNNINGFLAEPRNAESLAKCIGNVFQSEDCYQQLCIGARQHVINICDYENYKTLKKDFSWDF